MAPGATKAEIKSALRRLYVDLHPDTGSTPDPVRLTKVKLIAEVLLDDAARVKYDNTPDGQRLLDKVYVAELSRLNPATQRAIKESLKPKAASPYGTPGRFDYFSLGHRSSDTLKAQQWYHYLLSHITSTTFRGRLRVLLWDGLRPAWQSPLEVLMIPRSWEPSAFAARHLLTKVVESTQMSQS